jgi:hypothetical protein
MNRNPIWLTISTIFFLLEAPFVYKGQLGKLPKKADSSFGNEEKNISSKFNLQRNIQSKVRDKSNSNPKPDNSGLIPFNLNMSSALKQVLQKVILEGARLVSKKDGFFINSSIELYFYAGRKK